MNPIESFYNDITTNYEAYTTKYVQIDEAHLDKALMEHATFYSFVGAVVAYGKNSMEELDFAYESLCASVRQEAQANLVSKGVRPTKDALDTVMNTSQDIKTAKIKLLKAEYKYNLCKSLYSALEHRRDMLVQASSNRRSETKLYSQN